MSVAWSCANCCNTNMPQSFVCYLLDLLLLLHHDQKLLLNLLALFIMVSCPIAWHT
jgi:hypothetical protein